MGYKPRKTILSSVRGGAQVIQPPFQQKFDSYLEKRSQKMAVDEQIRTIRRLER